MARLLLLLSCCLFFFGAVPAGSAHQTLSAAFVRVPPVIDGSDGDKAWQQAESLTTADKTNGLPLTIKAVYTEKDIYLLVRFADPDESRTHKSWVWDEGRAIYTVGSDREDIFVFKWHMGLQPVDLSIYADNEYRADIWYWKACRTDGAGYADDKIHIFSRTEDRHAAEIVSRTGRAMYLVRLGDEGESAYRIDLQSEYQGEILPRFISKQPTGSRGDIRARGIWQNGIWTIEFGRRLMTGHDDDVQFDTDNKYMFGVSRYEIAGRKINTKLSDPLYGTGDVGEVLWLQFIK